MKNIFLGLLLTCTLCVRAYVPEDKTVPTQAEVDSALQQLKNSMVFVEGGTFMMGATYQDNRTEVNELPVHQVTISSFYVSKYEVTQALWRAVMGKLGYWTYSTDYECVVTYRSFEEIHEFIDKLNQLTGEHYRLLTEAEWEFAARGGNQSKGYLYSGSNTLSDVLASDVGKPGTKLPNELGLYDMTGNADEFVEDSYHDYTSEAQVNPLYRDDSGIGVIRGSNSLNTANWLFRVSARDAQKQTTNAGTGWIGFRLAKDTAQEPQPAKSRSFIISYQKGGQEQQASVDGIRFVASQYGKEAYAWQPADSAWQTYTSLAANGFDIQNVRSISRYRIELSESKGEELQQALEEEAHSGNADCNAIVAALQDNPNVADAQTDGTNVMVLEEGDSIYTVYPMIVLDDPFLTNDLATVASRLRREVTQLQKASKTQNQKIAIFNYFAGINQRAGQNAIVEGIRDLFKKHGYTVEYYDNDELNFTKDNIEKVVTDAHDNNAYRAVFIFSHGFFAKDQRIGSTGHEKSFYVTRDEYDGKQNVNQSNATEEHYYKVFGYEFAKKDYYNIALPVEDLKVGPNCLLYVGSCNAFDKTTILTREPWIGWTGNNRLAQAHAAIMVSRMLDYKMNLLQALQGIWENDGMSLLKYNPIIGSDYYLDYDWEANLDKTYIGTKTITLTSPNRSGNKALTLPDKATAFLISGKMEGELQNYFFVELTPLHKGAQAPNPYEIQVQEGGYFSREIGLPKKLRGIFELQASVYVNSKKRSDKRYVRLNQPVFLACSDEFDTNDAIVLPPAKDSKIVMTTAKTPGERLQFGYYYDKDIWFDMNNNGIREWGEYPDWDASDYITFQPTVQSQTFTIYGNLTHSFDCGSDNFDHDYNRLTRIDMSEFYGDLEQLFCAYNELTTLVLPKGTPLNWVWAANNQLTEVDASGLFFLQALLASRNKLTSVKLPDSYDLITVDVQGNPNLQSLDVTELPSLVNLYCQNCAIETLDVSQNTELAMLLCDGNRLSSLDLSANQQLVSLGCNYNSLDKDNLELIYRQLPDISNVNPDTIRIDLPQLFRMLRANGNPGFSEADKTIAEKKGWEFGDKWVAARRGRKSLSANGSGYIIRK